MGRNNGPEAVSDGVGADETAGGANTRQSNVTWLVGFGLALVVVIVVARLTGVTEYVSLDNLGRLRGWIGGFGVLAPIVFIVIYVVAVVAFLPATPLTLLAGLVFGAGWGTLWTWVGATIGATLAFLVGRYAARGLVESWTTNNERVKKLDEGVEEQGWRILLVTRLVPLFPFNLQNYAYGITKIGFGTYVLLTAVCILPGVIVYAFAGGSLAAAEQNLTRTFLYLGVAAVFFVIISLVPGWLRKRNQDRDLK